MCGGKEECPYNEKNFSSLWDACDFIDSEVRMAIDGEGDYVDYDLADIERFGVSISAPNFDSFQYIFLEVYTGTKYWKGLEDEILNEIKDLKALVE